MQDQPNITNNTNPVKESWVKPQISLLDINEETLLTFDPVKAIHFFCHT